ncbi:hypothetical protein HMPREF1068_02018 [Bacteroides nordii CL02T12C05]|jgi:hypothetical protein|uniref:Uncharacterized protein n=1 Tax=Bacteroides nordii CL02T12C05 TaxID=997884 RepID=I9S9L2_9BACE|nr:hypothetical protein HMPREF1068_02018 [Bacteroides nordii CL02T12C05]
MPAEPDSTNGVEMKRALSQVATGLFQICYIFNEVYTYEHCSLTTVGVVTGATTNMYLLTLFSLSFDVLWGQI